MLADSGVLGDNLLVWLVLALGAAMVVGYGMALLRPPPAPKGGRPRTSAGKSVVAKGTSRKGARKPSSSPGKRGRPNELVEVPRGRSFVMIGIGALATIWSAATLLKH